VGGDPGPFRFRSSAADRHEGGVMGPVLTESTSRRIESAGWLRDEIQLFAKRIGKDSWEDLTEPELHGLLDVALKVIHAAEET
jgi:hypothetical protein